MTSSRPGLQAIARMDEFEEFLCRLCRDIEHRFTADLQEVRLQLHDHERAALEPLADVSVEGAKIPKINPR